MKIHLKLDAHRRNDKPCFYSMNLVSGVSVQPSRRSKKRPVKSKKKLLELSSKICRCWVSHCAFEPAKC